MKKQRIVVVCPGRGSYTSETLGYLNPYKKHLGEFIADIDQRRIKNGDPSITELDQAEKFKLSLHTKGEHASALIYACSYADFTMIDRDRYEIVAVTGNSMGWYLALAMAESLNWASAFNVIQTMGGQMREGTVGGQIIYSLVDKNWHVDQSREAEVDSVIADINSRENMQAYNSIYLGGYRVIGANKPALSALMKELPKIENYPFQLVNHAAFHTPLLNSVSQTALETLPVEIFSRPKVPVIDGRGMIWQPYSTAIDKLHSYTLGHQVVAPYDFSTAISVALKEFCPDKLVLLGPGNSLGGALGQILISNNWQDISSKSDFVQRQKQDPFLVSMGLIDQRSVVSRAL